jgi:poly-gamma-glutamate synthesis protein (capsule biosynthesis protein)
MTMADRGQASSAGGDAILAAVGDIHAGDRPPTVSEDLGRLLAAADVVIVNQESPLSDRGQPHGDKSLHLRSVPAAVSLLKDLHASVAVLANNHICDWGCEALAQTVEVLDQAGIAHTGAGLSLEDASRPVIVKAHGVSLGILAFSETRIQAPAAGTGAFGVAPLELQHMVRAVRELRPQVDCVIVNAHWGYTNYHYPTSAQLALGRALVEAGATLVLGHHPHVVQGIEHRGTASVAYSLGNLVFASYARHGRTIRLSRENYRGLVLIARLNRQGVVSLEYRHSCQDPAANTLQLLGGGAAARRDRFVRRLSRPLGSPGYAAFFKRYVLRRFVGRLLRWLDPRQWSSLNRDYLRGVRSASGLMMKKTDAGDASRDKCP